MNGSKPPLPIRVAPTILLVGALYTLLGLSLGHLDTNVAISMDGVPISRGTFLFVVTPLIVLAASSSIAVGWGIRKKRRWARAFAFKMSALISGLALLSLVLLGRPLSEVILRYGWKLALGFLCLYWVLYGGGSVKEYFDRLELREGGE